MASYAESLIKDGFVSPLTGVNYIDGVIDGTGTKAAKNDVPDTNKSAEAASDQSTIDKAYSWITEGFSGFFMRSGIVIIGLVLLALGIFIASNKATIIAELKK